MNLSLVSFADPGDIDRERVVLKAATDLDTGDYTALCSESNEPGTASSGENLAYWFSNEKIKANDLVVLYTKTGIESKKDLGGRTAYFFYWGRKAPLWSKPSSVLVMIESADWTMMWPTETMAPEEPKDPSADVKRG